MTISIMLSNFVTKHLIDTHKHIGIHFNENHITDTNPETKQLCCEPQFTKL